MKQNIRAKIEKLCAALLLGVASTIFGASASLVC